MWKKKLEIGSVVRDDPTRIYTLAGHLFGSSEGYGFQEEVRKEIAEGITRRQVVRAGLSGPAQLLKGTTRTKEDDLLADLRYIERLRTGSVWAILVFDLRLLGRTACLMLKMTGE